VSLHAETGSRDAKEQFGENLRRLRDAAGMSQERLSLQSGVRASSISSIERGFTDPRLHTIVRLAAGLDVDPSELVRGIRP
jgi:transcriptional regulator with XRE-family HTH domain